MCRRGQRGLSGHTVLAYRDALKLYLAFVCQQQRQTTAALTVEDLTADTVRHFMDHLERDRKNSVPTRNARLAALHAFFSYLASIDPLHLAQAQTILAVRAACGFQEARAQRHWIHPHRGHDAVCEHDSGIGVTANLGTIF